MRALEIPGHRENWRSLLHAFEFNKTLRLETHNHHDEGLEVDIWPKFGH